MNRRNFFQTVAAFAAGLFVGKDAKVGVNPYPDDLIVLDSVGNLQWGKPGFVTWSHDDLHASVFVKDQVQTLGGSLYVNGPERVRFGNLKGIPSDGLHPADFFDAWL